MISKALFHASSFERTLFFFVIILIIVHFSATVAACDGRSNSPAVYFLAPEVPPETGGMPQGGPEDEIQGPSLQFRG